MHAFFPLLVRSWRLGLTLWRPILAGALIFGTLLFMTLGTFQRRADGVARQMVLGIGIDPMHMEALQHRMAIGDEIAFDEMLEELERVAADIEQMEEMQREEFLREEGRKISRTIMQLAAFFLVLTGIVMLLSSTYFLVLAVEQQHSITELLRTTLQQALPLAGVALWVLLRSSYWILIVAAILLDRSALLSISSIPLGDLLLLFLGILFAARFSFAGVILLREKKGIRESVKESHVRTAGHWRSLVGSLTLLLLVLWGAVALFGVLAQFTGPFMSWAILMFKQLAIAFAALFLVQLYEERKQVV